MHLFFFKHLMPCCGSAPDVEYDEMMGEGSVQCNSCGMMLIFDAGTFDFKVVTGWNLIQWQALKACPN